MASVFKAKGASKYTILYTDENDRRRKKVGTTDKAVSQRIANDLENKVALRRQGLIAPSAERVAESERTPLVGHVVDWHADLCHRGCTPKHAALSADRVRRLVAVMCGASPDDVDAKRMTRASCEEARSQMSRLIGHVRLSILSSDKVQAGLAAFRDSGRSLETCNHYRRAVRGFTRWAWKTGRLHENPLIGVSGFNAKEDRRHDRRTVSLEELQHLVAIAEGGPKFMGMPGQARALCYRLAVATGLRYSELASILPGSFDWQAPSVTVAAAYTKNGDPAVFPIPDELARDLAAYVATVKPGTRVFPLPAQKGAKMLRRDLEAAGIPYRDGSGLVFDFHSLRCELATLADAVGVTPRVVQKMMRHSTLELTGRYTRPRAVDIEAAADKLPSLKSDGARPEIALLTGTDSGQGLRNATPDATTEILDICKSNGSNILSSLESRTSNPKVAGSNPAGRASVRIAESSS